MKTLFVNVVIAICALLLCACPKNTPYYETEQAILQKYQDAKLDYLNGSLEKAQKEFREICEKKPDFFQARFMLGKTLFSRGNATEAESVFKTLVERYPRYHEAETWLVRSLIANDKKEEAAGRLREMLAFDSGDPRLLSLQAKLFGLHEDIPNAMQYYMLSSEYEEESAFNHLELARYYFKFGQTQKALEEIERCLLLSPRESAFRDAVEILKKTIIEEKEDVSEKK